MDDDAEKIQRRKALYLKTVKILDLLQEIYLESETDEEFLVCFEGFGIGDLTNKSLIDVVRNYDREQKRVILSRSDQWERMEKAHELYYDKWKKLVEAIRNHVAGKRAKDGGFKDCDDLILEDRLYRLSLMKAYRIIMAYENDNIPDHEKNNEIKSKRIPEKYRKRMKIRGDKTVVIEWMAEDYGCSINTLKQYIYRKR